MVILDWQRNSLIVTQSAFPVALLFVLRTLAGARLTKSAIDRTVGLGRPDKRFGAQVPRIRSGIGEPTSQFTRESTTSISAEAVVLVPSVSIQMISMVPDSTALSLNLR